jgi:signal transduction histidine kinase
LTETREVILARRLLAMPDYRHYWLGSTAFAIGIWAFLVSMGYSAKQLTDSPFRVSLVTVAYFMPMFLLALPSGVLADRRDRKHVVIACRGGSAVVAAVLATLLARRALRPLRRLSSGARAIERTGDASQRLPDPHARDEVGTLAETLNAMLASLERAREVEQRFVGDASHELRTPLTALRGNLAYVTKHGAHGEVLQDIAADAARLGDLLDDLLALAREDASAPARGEPVDLGEIAREAAADHVFAPDSLVVLAERPALERALDNLVRNARRHGSGAVTITVERDGNRARLSVTDEGPGLTPEQAEHAFERFWRGRDAASPGSGLGLAIVRAIAERHGGGVTVDGSRFTIDLPASHGSLKPRP